MSTNLDIWNAVCHTDPEYTKKTNNGKFDFTAVDPQYQLMEGTKLWGPYGSAWGLRNLRMEIVPVPGSEGKCVLTGSAEFFYPGGSFEIMADIPYRWNDDAYKKLWTSLRSKALSALGFNADIFLGSYDDEHYVSAMRTKFGDQDELRAKAIKAIDAVNNKASYEKCGKHIDKLYTETAINKTLHNELWELMDKKKMELVDNGQL